MAASDVTGRPQTRSSFELREEIRRPELGHLHTSLPNRMRYSIASYTAPSIDSCCAARVVPKKPKGLRNTKLSKTTRIALLLGIDTAFFLLELIVGYAVHSLALVADSFHMLNDVLSLCVGLWAVRIANKESSKAYTYGWQRAETLGALINGVFLIALCLSIFLQAIQRFVTPQTVSNPKLVLIVGCFGLASNVLGLFLFHEHGHSHGNRDETLHEHDPVSNAEEGHSHSHAYGPGHTEIDTTDTSLIHKPTDALSSRRSTDFCRHCRTSKSSLDAIHIYPTSIAAGHLGEQNEFAPDKDIILDDEVTSTSLNERLSFKKSSNDSPKKCHPSHSPSHASPKKKRQDHRYDSGHTAHNHSKLRDQTMKGGHGHSHGDLNIRGVFLHIMGDALGNIGVITSALFIWLTSFKWRFYVDPAISLLITAIILCSAIPLCKAASRILLQAAPRGLSVDDIKQDIEALPAVISAHHLHVWQLSNSKFIASLQVQVNCTLGGTGSAQYMYLAAQIRRCLRGYGIHSSTIQPEFCLPSDNQSPKLGSGTMAASSSDQVSPTVDDSYLLACGDDCANKNYCFPVVGKNLQ